MEINTGHSPSLPRRGTFTPQQPQELVDRFFKSGLSAKQFAQQELIGYSTLRKWLQLHRNPPLADSTARLIEIPPLPTVEPSTACGTSLAEVSLPSGVTVRIHGSVVTDFIHLLAKAVQ